MKHSRLIRTTALLIYVVPTVAPTFAAQSAQPAAVVAASLAAGPTIPQTDKLSLSQPAPSPSDPAPVLGDLTHLVFTATGGLVANLVSPTDGGFGGVSASIEVSTIAGAGVELKLGDHVVPFSRIGKRVVLASGETHYTYFGVALEPGPNTVQLTPLGAHGLRGTAKNITLFGAGRATKLTVDMEGKPVADGRTTLLLHLRGRDQWNNPARPDSTMKLTIVGGDAHFVGRHGSNGANPNPAASGVPGSADAAALAASPTTTLGAQPPAATPAPQTPAAPLSVAGAALNAPGDTVGTDRTAAVAPNVFATPFGNAAPVPGYDPTSAGQPDARGGVPNEAGENYRAVGDLNSPVQSIEVPLGADTLVPIIPGLRPGEVIIRVTDGEITTDERFYLAPFVRAPLVLGLFTVGAGNVPGIPGEVDTATNASDSRKARGALFATGAIGAATLATVAYNTADTLDENTTNGAYVDDPNNRPYGTYGDASDHRVDALSRDHLYARVDSGRSSALWGDFIAQTGGADGIGGFNLLVHGAQATIGGQNIKVTAFEARNDVAYARQVISPTGLAVAGTLLHPDIIVGSEIIELVSIDRRTGAIIAQNPLGRNVDYVLDNVTGQLRFINVPLPYDSSFNPQQLVVSYEYGGVSTNAETSGGRADFTFGNKKDIKLGFGFVNDSYGTGNYSLFSQDLSGVLPGGVWSVGHATSKGSMDVSSDSFNQSIGNGGDAYKASVLSTIGANRFEAGFEATTAGYDNPFGGLSTPGLLQYRLAYTRQLGKQNSRLIVSYDHEQNSTLGYSNSESNASVHLEEYLTKRFSFTTGIDFRSTSDSVSTLSTENQLLPTIGLDQPAPITPGLVSSATGGQQSTIQGELGISYRPIDPLKLSVSRLTNLSGDSDLSQPEQTAAEVSYEFKGKGRAYLRQLWSNAPQQSFAASTAALTSSSQATRSTAFGFEKAVGSNTTVDSEYVVDSGLNGSDTYSAIGIKERFTFGKNVHGDSFLQHGNAIGNGLSGFNIYGLELAYTLPAGVKVTSAYQLRTGDGAGSTLQLGAIGTLSQELTLLGSMQDSNGYGITSDDTSFGLAYRPYNNDRSVSLLSFRDLGGTNSVLGSKSEVVSYEQLLRPSWHLEIAGRYAYKLDGDDYYAAHTSLFGLRATQRVGNRFDIGAETRYLSAGITDASFSAFAMEGGYRLGDQYRLGLGYNFTGAPDPALAAAPTRRGVYATATSTVDNIFGWGKQH